MHCGGKGCVQPGHGGGQGAALGSRFNRTVSVDLPGQLEGDERVACGESVRQRKQPVQRP